MQERMHAPDMGLFIFIRLASQCEYGFTGLRDVPLVLLWALWYATTNR